MKTMTTLIIMAVLPAAAFSETIVVPDDYPGIQDAIVAAADGDEILVSPGTYNEAIDFLGKAIAVKSSSGPEVTILDASGIDTSVATCRSGEGPDTVLEGFTLTGGTGQVWRSGRAGGGMMNLGSHPTVHACVFTGNALSADVGAIVHGGGMCNVDGSSPTVIDCRFEANTIAGALYGGALGGGMYNGDNSHATVSGCTFLANIASPVAAGAGMFNENSSPIVRDCEFRDNSAAFGGGGMQNWTNSHPLVIGCRFSHNHSDLGGGILDQDNSNPLVIHCSFIANTSASFGGGLFDYDARATVIGCTFVQNHAQTAGGLGSTADTIGINSIFWGNTPNGIYGSPSMTYCDVEGGWPGEGNIDANPLFVDAVNEDLHLRLGSPCTDAGTNEAPRLPGTDFEGDDRIVDGDLDGIAVADIGMDELLAEVATRFGTVNAAGEGLANVLRVNGEAGNRKRIHTLSVGEAFAISMDPPPAGPDPAPFALYAWIGVNDATNCTPQPFALGTMCFPTILTGGDPWPNRIWNNIGKHPWLGTPGIPSDPAPSVVLSAPEGWPHPVTATLQGFILDNGSTADKPASVTNAVIVDLQ